MIWDMQEGVIAGTPRSEERWDDPADLEEQERISFGMARALPLAQATGRITATSLGVRESEESSLVYGENCLIWCSSIRPCNSKQWASWRASLKPSYDHVSTVRDPHMFAQALGAMAFQQKRLLGNPISFRNPQTRYVVQCPSLSVVYGPVVYIDDRRAYIEESISDLEFTVRSIFAKTSEHRHQREYRFALLTNQEFEDDTLDLMVSTEMRRSVTKPQYPGTSVHEAPSLRFEGGLPSPGIFQCFPRLLPTQRSTDPSEAFTLQVRSRFHLKAIQHKDTTTVHMSVQTVDDIDHTYIEQAIAEGSSSPSDARIVKFTLDRGPGSIFTIYDLDGLIGAYRIRKESGNVVLKVRSHKSSIDQRVVLIDNSDFDGSSLLSNTTNQLTLSYTKMNPNTTVQTEVSNAGDTIFTITATSEDGTATSSFEIIFDSSLGINVTLTGQAPAS